MKRNTTKMLVEGAMMLALAIVLSLITPFQKLLPFGGSITLVSMLPICIYSIKYGVGKGSAYRSCSRYSSLFRARSKTDCSAGD